MRALPVGGEIEQVSGNALAHRAECVDRGLLQHLEQAPIQLLGDGPGDLGIAPRRRGQGPRADPNTLDGSTVWTLVLAGPPTSTAIPSTSPGRA
jgi:hypothetical protein